MTAFITFSRPDSLSLGTDTNPYRVHQLHRGHSFDLSGESQDGVRVSSLTMKK